MGNIWDPWAAMLSFLCCSFDGYCFRKLEPSVKEHHKERKLLLATSSQTTPMQFPIFFKSSFFKVNIAWAPTFKTAFAIFVKMPESGTLDVHLPLRQP